MTMDRRQFIFGTFAGIITYKLSGCAEWVTGSHDHRDVNRSDHYSSSMMTDSGMSGSMSGSYDSGIISGSLSCSLG